MERSKMKVLEKYSQVFSTVQKHDLNKRIFLKLHLQILWSTFSFPSVELHHWSVDVTGSIFLSHLLSLILGVKTSTFVILQHRTIYIWCTDSIWTFLWLTNTLFSLFPSNHICKTIISEVQQFKNVAYLFAGTSN